MKLFLSICGFMFIILLCLKCTVIDIDSLSEIDELEKIEINARANAQNDCITRSFNSVVPDIPTATMVYQNCTSNYVIIAPHGGYDTNTDDIVTGVCDELLWDCIIADKYRSGTNPINVNRPTEGIGVAPENEEFTPRAEAVYTHLLGHFNSIISDSVNLYIEIHGQVGRENEIHIATVGIRKSQSVRIKNLIKRDLPSYFSDITVFIEPKDTVYYSATANKQFGMLNYIDNELESPALHIELPPKMRLEEPDYIKTISFLQLVLPKIVDQEFD